VQTSRGNETATDQQSTDHLCTTDPCLTATLRSPWPIERTLSDIVRQSTAQLLSSSLVEISRRSSLAAEFDAGVMRSIPGSSRLIIVFYSSSAAVSRFRTE